MDNKQFPEQELPEEPIPVSMEPLELEPQEEEPIFIQELFPSGISEPTEEAETVMPAVESIEDVPSNTELLSLLEAEPISMTVEVQPENVPKSDFMSRIPDVEEDYLPSSPVTEGEAEDNQPIAERPEEELDLSFLEDSLLPQSDTIPAPEEGADDQEYRDNGKDADTSAQDDGLPFALPPRKGRPKRKKGEGLLGIPSILVTGVWLALIVAIGVTLGRMLWVCAADVLAFGREDKPVTITIYEADTMEDIVNKLHDNGLIRYKSLFNLYADISDAEEDIQPGIYDLNTRYDYHALVNFMSPRSSREVVEGVLIPEGYTCQQIFALLEENKICTAVDIAAYAASGDLGEYWFLDGVERGSENCLEGFLFPDTYDFYKNSSPKEVLTKLLNNFETRFDEDMRARIDTLNAELTGDYTVREIVIVASLIEKEAAAPAESPSIAGVIYNRLFHWNYPAYLNIDAAIVYAQGGESDKIDTSLDSPYNTYTNIGLTPGPIANPGLASLKAALNPASHNYYYYVLNPSTGMHQFSTTENEHNAWIAEFYN